MIFFLFFLPLLVVCVAGGIATWRRWQRAEDAYWRHWCEDFARTFPGVCPICGFTRHAWESGHFIGSPGPHACPEGNGSGERVGPHPVVFGRRSGR